MKGYLKVSLNTLKDGEAIKVTDSALDDIVRNLQDPETDRQKTRKLVLEIEFVPSKERPEIINVGISCKTRLAPKIADGGCVSMGHDEGEVGLFQEIGDQGDLFDEKSKRVIKINP